MHSLHRVKREFFRTFNSAVKATGADALIAKISFSSHKIARVGKPTTLDQHESFPSPPCGTRNRAPLFWAPVVATRFIMRDSGTFGANFSQIFFMRNFSSVLRLSSFLWGRRGVGTRHSLETPALERGTASGFTIILGPFFPLLSCSRLLYPIRARVFLFA